MASPARHLSTHSPFDSSPDPTSTTTLRGRWTADLNRRFTAIQRVLREAVVERDVLGLGDGAVAPTVVDRGTRIPRVTANQGHTGLGPDAVTPPRPGAFNFPTNEQKAIAFMDWLDEQVHRGVLEVERGSDRSVVADARWTDAYVRSAYGTGAAHATASMRSQGVTVPTSTASQVFATPVHADALGLLYARTFSELDGITRAMEQQVSRSLTEGLAQGWNPNRTARELNDRVSAIGLNRARMMARTETIRAHSEASLNRYSEFSSRLGGVTVVAEQITAGDERVCPECQALEGRVFTLEDARGRIPVHVSCRCAFVAVRRSA